MCGPGKQGELVVDSDPDTQGGRCFKKGAIGGAKYASKSVCTRNRPLGLTARPEFSGKPCCTVLDAEKGQEVAFLPLLLIDFTIGCCESSLSSSFYTLLPSIS